MKRILSLVLLLSVLTIALSFTACGDENLLPDVPTYSTTVPDGVTHTVVIEVEKYGNITLELYESCAPLTVRNFVELASNGFYDGLIFHRVIENFMIQGGDPLGNGTGGSSTDIVGEFALNGVTNPLPHERGVISMARTGAGQLEQYMAYYGCNVENFTSNPNYMNLLLNSGLDADDVYKYVKNACDSASSQFFIVHKTTDNNSASLDGNYAAFGRVIKGMNVVDKIAAVSTNPSNNKPTTDVVIKRIYVVTDTAK